MNVVIARPEELEILRPLIGRSLVFMVTDKSEEWVGNIEEGERYDSHEHSVTAKGILKQVYISRKQKYGQSQVFF